MLLIEYPKKERNETEIQALLWYFLRKRKIDARLQVTGYNPEKQKLSNRLDIVVFVEKQARCIIECKSWRPSYAATAQYRQNNTKQLSKYRATYGIPVLVCGRANHITATIDRIKEFIK